MTNDSAQDPVEEPGTTHAAPGSGHPELMVSRAGAAMPGEVPLRFPLDKDEVTVGSGPDQDIRLDGLEPHHLTVYHDERDEYRVRPYGQVEGGSVTEPAHRVLRTGARVAIGPWEVTFQRAEYADHGRPFGGREGGELSDNLTQPPRPADRDDAVEPVGREGVQEQQND
ncbi:hypothetical protein EXU48_14715 [Occultella glacieicola]|uniref:FHA domain-containing protein n=1 Tax=Occultella glacieicola TaxID=2518684 RepID=A0ABY2E2X9_9MICO|nr:FHA domain-containing protein [Occultella glacieicola]TDE92763.1 hypothetical protein EXU48_14715 [Occultella glacieicola]